MDLTSIARAYQTEVSLQDNHHQEVIEFIKRVDAEAERLFTKEQHINEKIREDHNLYLAKTKLKRGKHGK